MCTYKTEDSGSDGGTHQHGAGPLNPLNIQNGHTSCGLKCHSSSSSDRNSGCGCGCPSCSCTDKIAPSDQNQIIHHWQGGHARYLTAGVPAEANHFLSYSSDNSDLRRIANSFEVEDHDRPRLSDEDLPQFEDPFPTGLQDSVLPCFGGQFDGEDGCLDFSISSRRASSPSIRNPRMDMSGMMDPENLDMGSLRVECGTPDSRTLSLLHGYEDSFVFSDRRPSLTPTQRIAGAGAMFGTFLRLTPECRHQRLSY